jgi:RNA polymerase sigma-70 factor (ECF subfamily)
MSNFESRLEVEIPSLRRYARTLLRDAERADDLLHDCLERALSYRHLFVRSDNLHAWLFRIMRNVYLNNLRATRRRPLTIGLDEGSSPATPAEHTGGNRRDARGVRSIADRATRSPLDGGGRGP